MYPEIALDAYGWDPDTIRPGANARVEWKCHTCTFRWHTAPNDRTQGSGCPNCATRGFNPGRPGVLYLMERDSEQGLLLKIGISNTPRTRHAHLAKGGWRVRDISPMMAGASVAQYERLVLEYLDDLGIPRGKSAFAQAFDGYTESWVAEGIYNPASLSEIGRDLNIDLTAPSAVEAAKGLSAGRNPTV